MTAFFLALIRLGKAVHRVWQDHEFRVLLALIGVLSIIGTAFYAQHEGWSYVDSLYFCFMTMSTVGYGDLTPTTDISKIFTIIYSVLTIGLFVGVVTKLAQAMLTRPPKHGGNQDHSTK
jgi:voltage-gated potassium channel